MTVTQQAVAGGIEIRWIAIGAVLLLLVAFALLLIRRYEARRWLELRVLELGTLSQAGRAIAGAQLDVDELCMLIYRQAHRLVDTWIFQLGLFEGNRYRIKVWIAQGERQSETLFDLDDGEGIVGWLRQTGQPLLVRDFETEMETLPVRPRYMSDNPPRSAVFVPLIAGETVIGAMAIQSYRPAAFTENHQRVLSIIANQAASAIENARLFQAERQRRERADTLRQVSASINSSLETEEILEGVLEGLEHLVAFDASAILFLNDDDTFTLRAARGLPAVITAVGQSWPMADAQRLRKLAKQKQAFTFCPEDQAGCYHRLLDFPADHSCLGAPIVIRDQLIGALFLDRREPGQYDADDVALVGTLASQSASALENARLYTAGQEEAWISTALLEMAEATSRATSVEEVQETVVRITPLLVGVDRCAILIWHQDEEVWEVKAAYDLDESQPGLSVGQSFSPGDWTLLDRLWDKGSPVVDEFGGMPGAPSTQDVETTLLALPLRAQGELVGTMVICFTGQVSFTEHRVKLIAGIANQAALAMESAQLVVAQQEEAWVSLALLQVAEAVANLNELADVLVVVARLTPLLVGVERCLVYLWEAERQEYVPGAAFGLEPDRIDQFRTTSITAADWPQLSVVSSEEMAELLLGVASSQPDNGGSVPGESDVALSLEPGRQAVLVPGPPLHIADALGLRIPLALPLQAWGEMMGVMVVDSPGDGARLTGRRLNILSGVAQQTATAIQSARLHVESVERQKLEQELQVARQIQASFLPDAAPQIAGWDLAAYWEGARQVSGDFYDFIPLADDDHPSTRWGFVVADVADKGVPAALFMALSRTLVRTMAIGGSDPAEVLAQANNLIMASARSDLFVTLFYAILNPLDGVLTFANGGHNLPLQFDGRSAAVTELAAQGMALGVVTDIEFEQRHTRMELGDLLLFYTDGVTDALNETNQEFGLERLCAVVNAHQTESAEGIVQAINRAVDDFVGDTPQFDDFTLVVLKREPGAPEIRHDAMA
jgi:sigma-B regulation protein RsbU (phosphoserine phosphatase)